MDSTRVPPDEAETEERRTPPQTATGVPYRPPAPVFSARPSPIGEIWKDLLLVALGFLAGFLFGRGTPKAPLESTTPAELPAAAGARDQGGDAATPDASEPAPGAVQKGAKGRVSR
jgi:hypothetical protein